jgi:hypothetical protein
LFNIINYVIKTKIRVRRSTDKEKQKGAEMGKTVIEIKVAFSQRTRKKIVQTTGKCQNSLIVGISRQKIRFDQK